MYYLFITYQTSTLSSMQIIKFSMRAVSFIRITGTKNTANGVILSIIMFLYSL